MSQFPQGVGIAYSVIPVISTLDEPLRSEVRQAFAESLRVVWQVLIGIAGIGLLSSLFMRGLPLHTEMDRRWAMDNVSTGVDHGVESTSQTSP